ncbi:MAG: hypothetical protein DRI84_06945, partial [Bacteroidetes bacterium]
MRKLFPILILFLVLSSTVISQTRYTPIDTISLPLVWGTQNSTLKWIDFDNDNDFDLAVISSKYINIYKNFGNDSFALQNNYSFPFVLYRGIGDFDKDGDIDILASTSSNTIFLNTLPDSTGFDTISITVPTAYLRSGWLNIFNRKQTDIIGTESFYSNPPPYYCNYFYESDSLINYSLKLTINDTGYFVTYSSFNGNIFCHNYDVNNDGYFDFVSIRCINFNNGIDSINRFTRYVYSKNPFYYPSAILYFNDINNDGYIDKSLSTKFSSYEGRVKFYKNNQQDTFVEVVNTGIDTTLNSPQCFFDYNNDGKIDLLISKANGNNAIYANFSSNSNYYFTENSLITNLNKNYYTAAVADYDNDGDVDIAMLLLDSVNFIYYIALYRNDSTPPNTPPTAPLTMWTTIDSTKVIFHWNRATDVETPQITLSYNLMVGTSSKAIDITSPMADTVTGFRRVVELGNAQLNNFYILDKSIFNIGDTVYWSVQTIDNGFGYSPFSQEGSAIIYGRMEAPVFDTICGNDSVYWRGSYYTSSGRYKDSYTLDSAFFLDLEVHPSYLDKQYVDICSGSTYTWNGNTYYNSGIYNIQHYTSQGCDSVERLVLNVRPDYTTLLTEDICMGDSLLFAGKYLNSNGVYWDTLNSIYTCDSLLELTLTVSPADTSIVQSGDTLFATPQNASFRWWNCDKQEFVYAAYQSYFAPFQNGHYAAEISANGCSYLTQCYKITGLSIDNTGIPDLEVNLMPNPNDGEFYLELKAQGKQEYKIQIFDALGKEIYNQQIEFENYKKL